MREYTKDLLKKYARDVFVAVDGKDGLEQFVKIKPDIVITDINMPNIDGMQMSKMIKNSYKDIPIVLLTEFDKTDNLKKAIILGIDSFLSKPIKDDDLIAMLESIAQKLQNKIDAKRLKEVELEQQKIEAMLRLIKEIGHHWRQPLSAILALSSGYEIKKLNNLYKSNEEEIADIHKISEQIKRLSTMLLSVEEIDFRNISLEEIEKIIHISDPLYS